jgi:hypothetical protein
VTGPVAVEAPSERVADAGQTSSSAVCYQSAEPIEDGERIMDDRVQAIARAERVLSEIEAAQTEGAQGEGGFPSPGGIRTERVGEGGQTPPRARHRKKKRTKPADLRKLLLPAIPLAIAIVACFIVMLASSSDTLRNAAGIVGLVLLLILGVIGGLIYAKANDIPVKDVDQLLKDAEAALKDLLGIVKAPGNGSGGTPSPGGGSTPAKPVTGKPATQEE